MAFTCVPLSRAYPPITMKGTVTLVQDPTECRDRHSKLARGSDETASTDEAWRAAVQYAHPIGRHLQQLEKMEPLIARAMIVIESVGVDSNSNLL